MSNQNNTPQATESERRAAPHHHEDFGPGEAEMVRMKAADGTFIPIRDILKMSAQEKAAKFGPVAAASITDEDAEAAERVARQIAEDNAEKERLTPKPAK